MSRALPAAARDALAEVCPDAFPREAELDVNGPVVPVAAHVAVASALKAQGYTLYVSVIASHHPTEAGDTFEVATVLRDPRTGHAFWWRVQLGAEPAIPTLFPLFAGADWQEREQYDLVGVRFTGHPDLRRLMMSEDWEGHPLRKDYAIETRHAPWR